MIFEIVAEILNFNQIYLRPLTWTEESGTIDSRRNFWNGKSKKKLPVQYTF